MSLELRDSVTRVMMIKGAEYKVENGFAKISDLQFWDSNPRIYSKLEQQRKDGTITKDLIYNTMISFKDFDKLRNQIRDDKGINEPLIVCLNPVSNEYTVYEGNTRLAIAIQLFENDKPKDRPKWSEVQVNVLPDGTDAQVINRLIGTMQLTGKIDWRKFEESSYIYRQVKEEMDENKTNQQDAFNIIKDTYGIKAEHVKKAYKTCKFMIEQHKMSYAKQENFYSYWELLATKGPPISKLRKNFNDPTFLNGKVEKPTRDAFDKFIIQEVIKGEQIQRISGGSKDGGTAFRDDIDLIAKAFVKKGDVSLVTEWMEGNILITEAVERAKMGGAGNAESEKLADFAKWLCTARTMKDLQNAILNFPEIKKEIDTIIERMQIATSKLEKNLNARIVQLENSNPDHIMYKLCICMALVDNNLHIKEVEKITEILNSGEWLIGDVRNHDVLDAVDQVSRESYEYGGITKAANIYGALLKGKEQQKKMIDFMSDIMLADKRVRKSESKLIKQLRELWNI